MKTQTDKLLSSASVVSDSPNQSNETREGLLEAAKTAADWLSRSTRIDDREQGEDLRVAIGRYESLPGIDEMIRQGNLIETLSVTSD